MRFDGATCTETIRPSSEARCVREIVIRRCRGRIPRQKQHPYGRYRIASVGINRALKQ